MRPLTSSGLKRRMNELERALVTTVAILVLLLCFTMVFWLEEERYRKTQFFFVEEVLKNNYMNKEVETTSLITTRVEDTLMDMTPDEGKLFLPGYLSFNRTEVLHRCYLDEDMHLPHGQGCSLSKDYKIVFHLTPKSGSSTGRHVIKEDFNGVDYSYDSQCRSDPKDRSNWIEVAVLRNPATRAFASYEEMFVRRLGNPEAIPENARKFMEPFRGWIYKNYSALFDTKEGVWKLTRAYEQFMQDWKGDAFDMHLESQVAYNVKRRNGQKRPSARYLDFVFDTHTMEESFAILAKKVHLKKIPKVIKGRAYPRRMNVSDINDEAYQAMCRRYRHDFCCLNYKLPPQCLHHVPEGERVRCRWVKEGDQYLIDAVVV